MDDISEERAACWRQRLHQCMSDRGLTQLGLVSALNKQYLTKFHQKDVSRWLNTGSKTATGTIGFPKYETMLIIADFFNVDVGYLTGETSESTFDLTKACTYTGLAPTSVLAIRKWIKAPGGSPDDALHDYRAATLNGMLSSNQFSELAAKMLTVYEMSEIWRTNPERFSGLMGSLAASSDLPDDLTFQLIISAFYGMASETFSSLLRNAFPTPSETEFARSQHAEA